jgi:hypothetical protein
MRIFGALIGEELQAITNCRELFINMAACEPELLRYIMYLVAFYDIFVPP